MKQIVEWFKIIVFFIVLIMFLSLLVVLGEEKPHKVIIDGKEYIKMTEWTGNNYQTIILPADSSNIITK